MPDCLRMWRFSRFGPSFAVVYARGRIQAKGRERARQRATVLWEAAQGQRGSAPSIVAHRSNGLGGNATIGSFVGENAQGLTGDGSSIGPVENGFTQDPGGDLGAGCNCRSGPFRMGYDAALGTVQGWRPQRRSRTGALSRHARVAA